MTEILVMSQFDAERYADGAHNETCSVISITSHGDDEAQVYVDESNGIKDILRLQFNDTDEDDGISEDDAEAISEFVKHAMNLDRLIVHCGAGQSRSAGVAAAIMKIYFNDDTPVFNNRKYTPNMRCYRKVLENLNKSYDEAREKLDSIFRKELESMPSGLRSSVKLYTCCFMQLIAKKMSEEDIDETLDILDKNLNILLSARNDLYKTIKPDTEIPKLLGEI